MRKTNVAASIDPQPQKTLRCRLGLRIIYTGMLFATEHAPKQKQTQSLLIRAKDVQHLQEQSEGDAPSGDGWCAWPGNGG